MPALGLALGLPYPQGLFNGDPLSKLLLALRLQTHARQVDHYEDGFLVSGAGSSEMNGPYSASPTGGVSYFKLDGSRRRIIDDPDAWRIQVENIANYYEATGDSPVGLSYTSLDQGVNPAPSVRAVRVPFYKTVGLFKDVACTVRATQDGDSVAAWRDEWYFRLTGLFRGAIQANPMKQPKLRFVNGGPVLRFDGLDDYMQIASGLTLQTLCVAYRFQGVSKYGECGLVSCRGNAFDGYGIIRNQDPGANEVIATYPNAMDVATARLNDVDVSPGLFNQDFGSSTGIDLGKSGAFFIAHPPRNVTAPISLCFEGSGTLNRVLDCDLVSVILSPDNLSPVRDTVNQILSLLLP